ncbi:MAG: DEAD/DEAH box helicase [Opitutaceae bacterium]|nr:DEAD/DEAH box helicase [Opitutaceae bacterium]
MPFSKLGLHTSLLRGVQAMGYTDPTPIQLRAIPVVLSGRDLIASAQTGTGKTAAFALPVLNRLGPHRPGHPRVLVLEPTRELAAQVETAFRDFGRFTDVRATVIHGGVGYGRQRGELRAGSDIVIATVGRLLDFLQEKTLRLDSVEVLILDEVDRMLDMGFINDVKRIVELCPKQRQTLFFSATVPPEIEAIARFALKDPARIEIGVARSVNESVKHAIFPVVNDQKFDLLLGLLEKTDFQSVIIFSRTKHGADRIARRLKSANHSVAVLHANRSQNQRVEALEGFKAGRYEIMVATDIAARGIDVAGVSHVINYDVPENPEDYVHRIGRTGRAMAVGDAFTLAIPENASDVRDIERFIGNKIPQLALDAFPYLGGRAPVIDTQRPGPSRPKSGPRAGRGPGSPGRNQSRDPGGRPHGGGNPSHHPSGKPGQHWRRRDGR